MTNEFEYYPYKYQSTSDCLPMKLQELVKNPYEISFNIPTIINKLLLWVRNASEDSMVLIRCIDYMISGFLFPLSANTWNWEMYHEQIKLLLYEEARIFEKNGMDEKEDVIKEITSDKLPDLNQMFNRMRLYSFYAEWYSKSKNDCCRLLLSIADDNYMDIECLLNIDKELDPFVNQSETEKITYLTEISHWLRVESEEGGYKSFVVEYYSSLLSQLEEYNPKDEAYAIYEKIKIHIIKDYREILTRLITEGEDIIQDLQDKLDIRNSLIESYNSALNECNAELYRMEVSNA